MRVTFANCGSVEQQSYRRGRRVTEDYGNLGSGDSDQQCPVLTQSSALSATSAVNALGSWINHGNGRGFGQGQGHGPAA
jgi:hypothetical protein